MLCDVILKVPEGLDIMETDVNGDYLMPVEVLWEISQLDGEWPGFIMPSSHTLAGYKLIHASISVGGNNPLGLLQGLIDLYELGWEVMCMHSFNKVVPAILDDNGDILEESRVEVYKALDVRILDYLNDRYTYDENGDPISTRTKEFSWIPIWAGQGNREVL